MWPTHVWNQKTREIFLEGISTDFPPPIMIPIETLLSILTTPDIDTHVAALLNWADQISSGPGNSALYILSMQRAQFMRYGSSENPPQKDIDSEIPEDRTIICRRGSHAIGFIEWTSDRPRIHADDYALISAMIENLYRRIYSRNFFANIRRPIDFTNQDTYYRDTAKLISDTLSMEMVAISKINTNNALYCESFFKYPADFEAYFDFESDQVPPPFLEVIERTRRILAGTNGTQLLPQIEIVDPDNTARYGFLKENSKLESVRAFFLFPIICGDEFFGVASCSTTAKCSFSEFEKTAIQTAMQLLGVAIANFRRFHEVTRMANLIHDQLFSATELEIAQSARHELQNIEAEQALQADELRDLSRRIKDPALSNISLKLSATVLNLGQSIAKLRYSAIHAAPKLEKTSIKQIWDEAKQLIEQRLLNKSIKTRYVGSDLTGEYFADWLREAFLNLLFNSIDAFEERPKQNRLISLVVQKDSSASIYHVLDYSDNAGGIAYSKIRVPEPIKDANPNMDMDQLIFQPKVTSKRNHRGAGWGLYLVRQALRLHKGSISLKSTNKEGSTFRIQLVKDLNSHDGRDGGVH